MAGKLHKKGPRRPLIYLTSLNPLPNAHVIHKSLKILIEKNVGDLGNRKRNGGHVGVSAKTMPMKSTLGSMPAHGSADREENANRKGKKCKKKSKSDLVFPLVKEGDSKTSP
jgi:hypothetical protein